MSSDYTLGKVKSIRVTVCCPTGKALFRELGKETILEYPRDTFVSFQVSEDRSNTSLTNKERIIAFVCHPFICGQESWGVLFPTDGKTSEPYMVQNILKNGFRLGD